MGLKASDFSQVPSTLTCENEGRIGVLIVPTLIQPLPRRHGAGGVVSLGCLSWTGQLLSLGTGKPVRILARVSEPAPPSEP